MAHFTEKQWQEFADLKGLDRITGKSTKPEPVDLEQSYAQFDDWASAMREEERQYKARMENRRG